jgi:Protein of unknown function (DUF3300)
MNRMPRRCRPLERLVSGLFAIALLLSGARVADAQDTTSATAAPAAAATADSAQKLTPDQLQSLVAPIALYPDDLLTQTLVASTYPLEIVALHQYLAKHPDLKDKALADSVAKQPWDPSIQSMAAVPEVVKRLSDDIQWTTELGNAFLAQQKEVMDAVQVMRKKAKDKGALESNEQQKVETQVIEKKEVIVVQSANPEVIYVPTYSPTVVYGAPVYPYPPIYYPYYPPGAAFVSFSVGMMWGAAMWGGACCRYGWGGGGNVYINNRNNFNNINVNNRNTNINNRDVNRGGNRGGNNWQHNPSHRGGAPYGDRATADKFGGSARGDAAGNRAGTGNRASTGQRGTGVSDRSASTRQGGASGNRAGGGAGGGDKIGNQSIPRDGGSRASSGDRAGGRDYGGSGGFSGGARGYDGGSARASSSRGASSMGGRSGGFGGGGGRGGGGRRR